MLMRTQESSLKRVEKWITSLAPDGFDVQTLPKTPDGKERYSIQLSHRFVDYKVEIVFHGETVSFAALLLDAGGTSRAQELYQYALELNSYMNAAHIAVVEEGKLVLMHSFIVKDFAERWIYRDLANFNEAHEYAFGKIIEKYKKLKAA